MKNISCVIIEDEPRASALLEAYISKISFLQLKGKFIDGTEALAALPEINVDLVFLDINLPGINGMEVVALLRGQHVIFTTAYSEFALESYGHNAVDYLLKPINFTRFLAAVDKARFLIETKRQAVVPNSSDGDFFIKSGKKILRLQFSAITHLEAFKEYVIVYAKNEKHLVYKRMKELEQILPSWFVRVHNSYIINTRAIDKIENNHVIIGTGRYPISEKYKDAFYKTIDARTI